AFRSGYRYRFLACLKCYYGEEISPQLRFREAANQDDESPAASFVLLGCQIFLGTIINVSNSLESEPLLRKLIFDLLELKIIVVCSFIKLECFPTNKSSCQ